MADSTNLIVIIASSIILIVLLYILTQSKVLVVQEEERLVIYRLGRFHRVAGPGVVVLQRMLDEVKRTFNVRDEPHNVRVNGLFMNGVPFGYTLNFWYRFDLLASVDGNHERLAKLVQFSDEEREKQVATKVREALVVASPVIEQRFKPTSKDFVGKLLPIIPGLPSFDAFMEEVQKHLRKSLPLVGAILNEEHPIIVTNIHLGSDIVGAFSRGRVATMLRETFPNLPPAVLLQAISSIEGIDMPQQRVVFEGIDTNNTHPAFRVDEDNSQARIRVQPSNRRGSDISAKLVYSGDPETKLDDNKFESLRLYDIVAENVAPLIEKWNKISEIVTNFHSQNEIQLDEFVQLLSKVWKFSQENSKPYLRLDKVTVYHCESAKDFHSLTPLKNIPLIFFQTAELNESTLVELKHFVNHEARQLGSFSLAFIYAEGDDYIKIYQLLRNKISLPYAYNIIPINTNILIDIVASREPQLLLRRFILQNIDLILVSPFTTNGPVSDQLFIGRETEIRKIIETANKSSFAIIGGRRIGKSSLLGRLYRLHLPDKGYTTLYHDCSTTPDYQSFLDSSLKSLYPKELSFSERTLGDLIRSTKIDTKLVLLLDEVDKLISADQNQNWKLFNVLRAFTNSGQGQVVLSGERTLRIALRDAESPLFNFANELILRPFELRETEELVTKSMKNLELDFENEDETIQLIHNFTSGHPNIVQRLCSRLLERHKQGTRRTVTLSDVKDVITDPVFQRDDFLDTFWEAATPLEKVISLVMVDMTNSKNLQSIRENIKNRCGLNPKVGQIDNALQQLVDLRSLLKRTSTGYEFAVSAFPKVIAGTMTQTDMLEILAEEYREVADEQ